jgi:hypothetical protein
MSKGLTVSDHAFCRYLERINGYDVDAMKAVIRDQLEPLVKQLGYADAKITLSGITYIIKDGVLVTLHQDIRH